jgi:hypothetical protein
MQGIRPHEKQRKKLTPPSHIRVSGGGDHCHCLSLSSDDTFLLSVVGMLALLALSAMGIVGIFGIVRVVGIMGIIHHWSGLD